MNLFVPDEEATAGLGEAIAPALRPGLAICLYGPLGAGKSTLARALIRALTTPDEEVPSPTFTLVQSYEAGLTAHPFSLAHFDLYRLTSPDEAYEIGFDEALAEGAVIVEWPQRLGDRLPLDRLDIEIRLEGDGRRVQLTPHGAWKDMTLGF
jgi:tRNA threonylcarbamoyladenosine biosynthesis protein TsaE